MLIDTSLVRKIVALVYVGIGLGFHIRWKRAQAVCREAQITRREFVIPLRYTPISHYQCCSGAAANLRNSRSMVAFFARRNGTSYYVEIGIFE